MEYSTCNRVGSNPTREGGPVPALNCSGSQFRGRTQCDTKLCNGSVLLPCFGDRGAMLVPRSWEGGRHQTSAGRTRQPLSLAFLTPASTFPSIPQNPHTRSQRIPALAVDHRLIIIAAAAQTEPQLLQKPAIRG